MAVKLVTQETLTDCGLACVAMVSGQSLATVRKVAIKELGYPKDGPYTTTHENLFKLLAHFGIGHGKKAPFKSLAAMPPLAIMETRKMAGQNVGMVADSLLAGAMAIHFADSALVFRSPLRFACCQTGTVVGIRSSGAPLTLGYRFDVVPSDDVDGLFAACVPRRSLAPDQWSGLSRVGRAQSVFLLAGLGCLGRDYFLRLRLLDRGWCSVSYRPDLDGAIEFSPANERVRVPQVVVESPSDEFGWLHPASPYPFVLDDRCWRSAHPRDWPWPLPRVQRSQPTDELYRGTLRRALLARFAQHDRLHARLLALRRSVSVEGVPDGLIEEITSHFQTLHGQRAGGVAQ